MNLRVVIIAAVLAFSARGAAHARMQFVTRSPGGSVLNVSAGRVILAARDGE